MPSPLPVPERIDRLKAELFSTPDSVCFARGQIVTDVYRETEGEHPALRRAKALAAVFDEMPLLIRPGELIVGQRASRLGARAIYPEFHLNGLAEEETPPEIWGYWRGRTLGDQVKGAHPQRLRLAEKEMAAGYCTGTASGFGHVIVDYEKALTVGFRGIIVEAEAHLAACPAEDTEGQAFLRGVILAAQGIIRWAERYAALADDLAAREPDFQRAEELRRIAANCRRVPAEPARDFWEALQSFWFVHLAMHIEQYGWSISAGRFDQYMWPFYRDTLACGAMNEDEAWELLLNLWVKFMENVGTRIKATTFQNLTLGGAALEGRDQSNALSHLCLDATLALRMNQPALSVRWHPGIDPAFWTHVHETIAAGMGLPALFNDAVIVDALTAHGVSMEDAVGYGIVGCVEACVPGKMQGVTAGGHINVAKALELALNEGRSLLTSEQIGVETPAPDTFGGFDDLWDAYVAQVTYLGGLNILATILAGEAQKRWGHCPLMSSLLGDCLASRRDLVWGGTRYNLPGIAIYGPTNVYDGLMAIKRWVCDEGRLSWAALRQALADDFIGHDAVRQMLVRGAPRFGNDIAEVDVLANRVNAVHAEFCWQHVDSRNGRYTCGVWPVEGHVHAGVWTGATPDGRRTGEPLVDGVGACQGADRQGPTALLRSVAALNNVRDWPAGNTFNIKFDPKSVREAGGVARMAALSSAFMAMGGQELQINVVDVATLRAAQEMPEAYGDLIVRVAGFSAYFTQLGRATQDEIISRTAHAV
jgi:pyruvate formate-lyase/glycerol dehydratase family glycyl radical enzyme